MKDIVIIPTYDRPEYLSICFEKLAEARGIENKEFWVCQDNHIEKMLDFTTQWETLAAIKEGERLLGKDRIKFTARDPHSTYGNSKNLLDAIYDAYAFEHDVHYVYIVEDDVAVMPDFFEWHEAAQEKFVPFVSCAGRLNRSLNFHMNGPEAIDETIKDPLACVGTRSSYHSWANCYHRESMNWILNINSEADFKPGLEQDIIIQNLMKEQRHTGGSIFPFVPRAYHMGWYSYHRTAGMKFEGNLKEKVDALRRAITNRSTIRAMAALQEIDPFPNQPIPEYDPKQLFLLRDYR